MTSRELTKGPEEGLLRVFSSTEPLDRNEVSDMEESLVDRHSDFNGSYKSARNLRIEGVAEGDISCKGTLTVAEGARVSAKVAALHVTVAGQFEGEVTCDGRFQILPTGRVSGKVTAGALVVHEGAFYEGELHMLPKAEVSAAGSTSSAKASASGSSRQAGSESERPLFSSPASREASSKNSDAFAAGIPSGSDKPTQD